MEPKTAEKSLDAEIKEGTLERSRAKELAGKAAANVFAYAPAPLLNLFAKKAIKELKKNANDPKGEDPLVHKIKTEFGVKMAETFIHTSKRGISRNCRKKLFNNLFVNAIQKGRVKRLEFYAKHGWFPPGITVFNPTMRCNLSCEGCYAFEYNKKKSGDLSYETMNKIINEGKSFGQYFFVITGGEPMIRKDDIYKLAKEHNDCVFMMYTNGTLFTEEAANQMEDAGNWFPCISVEGFEKENDSRRGKGTHQKILRAMHNLSKAGVPFLISVTTTKQNQEMTMSKEFIQYWHEQGAFGAWYFQYMPVGKKPNLDLIPTPAQRRMQRKRIHEFRRSNFPMLLMDFWSDGPLVNGCIAAGIGYLNITGDGRIQPCVFTHFDVGNIQDMTIEEALDSPFFKEYRKRQKTIKDRYRPCGIIDHPEHLREAVEASGVKPSYEGADDIIADPNVREKIDTYAKEVKETIGKDWDERRD